MTRVAVVGGGLAGITAALRCADGGAEVTLYEAKPRLGGLTYSMRRGELEVDNGQHVFLRCCTSYRSLLDRLGVADQVHLQERLDIPVASAWDTRRARLRRTGLPAPAHLSGSLLRYRLLSPAQRLRFVRAALALRALDREDAANDRRTFGDWLREHGQDARTVQALWDLVSTATLNSRADDASLALAAMVFQVGLLMEAGASDIGWSRVPLRRLHGDAAAERLAAAGVAVNTATKVISLEREPSGWTVGTPSETHPCDQVILAVPPLAARSVLPDGSVDLPVDWAERLGVSPIVNIHIVLRRVVLTEPFLAVVGSPVQWVFDRTVSSGLVAGQYLAVSISAADGFIDRPVAQIRSTVLAELGPTLGLRPSDVVDFFVTREREATFRPGPGSRALRPETRTRAPGLFLAGAWTDTGWPATMEGAVRSGDRAARAVLERSATTAEVPA
jgi:squalene-associated FAD-dependent desaturase